MQFARPPMVNHEPVASQSMAAPLAEVTIASEGEAPLPSKPCLRAVESLLANTNGDYFSRPVDWNEMQIPEYPKIVKSPMDLGTIKSRLDSAWYSSFAAFAADVQLVWDNAKLFNEPGSEVHEAAIQMEDIWSRKKMHLKKMATKMGKETPISIPLAKAISVQPKRSTPSRNPARDVTSIKKQRIEPYRSVKTKPISNGKPKEEDGDRIEAAIASRKLVIEELRSLSAAASSNPATKDAAAIRARELDIEELRIRCREAETTARAELAKKMLDQGLNIHEITEAMDHIFS
uniref:Bromo domain-containing protein n=1 Tax=Spongospora subterranea TaxID=70186 RepID=A0A0H5RPS3_9EUKA|eukprot:CRZ10724.1 hypothetical protein [Spongospora subterranea]